MTEHLARLSLEGAGSIGRYTPHAFDLRLLGVEQAADHIVYLHEVHHAALNDVTAWGSALHVHARLPDAGPAFARLLDACRTVHESLATFASVQIATARHGALDAVLAAYPRYVPLYQATDRLTRLVAGPNRRQLLVTALARLCMQTPILDTITDAGLEDFRLALIPLRDRPDARWNWFLRAGKEAVAAAAERADEAVTSEFGPDVVTSDGPGGDLYTATDRSHDEAWDRWEAVAYEHLRSQLAATGAQVLPLNGHQPGTARLVQLAHDRHGELGLRAAMTDDQRRDDASLASSVLQQVHHDLSGGERHRAVRVPLPLGEVVRLLGDRPVIDGRPALIVDARRSERTADLYRWPPGEEPPAVAVRLFVEDDEGEAVGHAEVTDPAALQALAADWGDRGIFAVCVGAGSLAEPGFAARWLPATPRPVFVLVDVEPDRFVPRWAAEGRTVIAIPLQVADTGGNRTALLFSTADEGEIWWLVVADDVTVRLMIEYLRGHLGDSLRIDASAFGPIREVSLAVVTHVLATESFTSFDALGSGYGR